jgi:transcriptional regulator with XRE-family HTH domain
VTIAEQFGRNLARARCEAGLSQEEVAARASLHRTAVGQLERGERAPRVETLVKLMGALGVEPHVLLAGMEWQPGQIRIGCFKG